MCLPCKTNIWLLKWFPHAVVLENIVDRIYNVHYMPGQILFMSGHCQIMSGHCPVTELCCRICHVNMALDLLILKTSLTFVRPLKMTLG